MGEIYDKSKAGSNLYIIMSFLSLQDLEWIALLNALVVRSDRLYCARFTLKIDHYGSLRMEGTGKVDCIIDENLAFLNLIAVALLPTCPLA